MTIVASPGRPGRGLAIAAAAVLGLALAYRLVLPFLSDAALRSVFATEDGYLMLTVARNLALGLGLSVSDGTIPTNGIQPLATFLYALPYLATGGDKLGGLAGVMLISAAISCAGAWTVWRFGRDVLALPAPWPLVLAALWFATPLSLLHSMNALETGLNVTMVLACVLALTAISRRPGHLGLAEAIGFGSLLGLAFLTRIDNAVLVAALLAARLADNLAHRRLGLAGNVRDVIVPGAMSLLWAAPWLAFNWRLFGSIMPISGTAQSMTASFGENLVFLPVRLFEAMVPVVPVPGRFETAPWMMTAATVVVATTLVLFLALVLPRRGSARAALIGFLAYAAGLSAYYGLAFGAAHFLSRYFAAFVPLLTGIALAVGLEAVRRGWLGRRALAAAGVAALALACVLTGRLALPGARVQGHFQVVDWVEANVPAGTWVGAVQTGTLGYWHDRTINLDGKVNPAALKARAELGDVRPYVIDSAIDYVADWKGIAGWVDGSDPAFAAAFELIVDDPALNLAVLKRR
jgi:hypothetical protein